jgi:hypothetical protein
MTFKLMSKAVNDGRMERDVGRDEEKHRNEFTQLLGGQLDCNEALRKGPTVSPKDWEGSQELNIHLFKISPTIRP